MTEVWALTLSAADADSSTRHDVAESMRAWVAAGGSGVPLVTCHRAELYGLGEIPRLAPARLVAGVPAVWHLFRVAAGLESAVVGEDEVLHQVRQALSEARAAGLVDHRLARLLEMASAAGRRARAGRTDSPAGLAEAAVEWLGRRVRLAGSRVMVVGAGRMGSALARAARASGARLTIASRGPARASRLAFLHAGEATGLAGAAVVAARCDAVAIALAGPWPQVSTIHCALPPVADLSSPSVLTPEARSRAQDFLGIDQLFTRGTPPQGYVETARPVVDEWASRYVAWLDARETFALNGRVAS